MGTYGKKAVLLMALLMLLLLFPTMAGADTDIRVTIAAPGHSGTEEYQGTTLNSALDTPTVYFGDNRTLGTLRVTGKKEISVPVKAGDRIMAILPEGLCYMKAPDAENFRSYVEWPKSVGGEKNRVQKIKFIAGTPRSITVEFEGMDQAGGAMALDFVYSQKNLSTVRVAPFIKKVQQYRADPDGKVTRKEFFELLAENTLPFSACPLKFNDSDKTLAQTFSDTAPMTSSELSNARLLVDSGVLAGCGGGLLRPEEYITRAEAAHLVGKVFPPAGKKAIFTDPVPGWATGVDAAAALEIVAGYPDGSFRPDEFISRQEVLTLLQRMIESFGVKGN